MGGEREREREREKGERQGMKEEGREEGIVDVDYKQVEEKVKGAVRMDRQVKVIEKE